MSKRGQKGSQISIQELAELLGDMPNADQIIAELAIGKTPEDIIRTALQEYLIMKHKVLKELNTEQLMASFFFWDMIYQRMLRSTLATSFVWNMLANTFFRFLDVYSVIYQSANEAKSEEAKTRLVKEMTKLMREWQKNFQQFAQQFNPLGGGLIAETNKQSKKNKT